MSLAERVARVLAAPRISKKAPPEKAPWELEAAEPPDLSALHDACGGLELEDGTRVLGRGEIARATVWMREERALGWDDAILVVGERDDLVVVRDLDPKGERAGGGVLEAPTDGLETFRRVALDVVGYLEARLGLEGEGELAPERAARKAIDLGDADALEGAIARGFYPGSERELAQLATRLGALRAKAGDAERAMASFEEAVQARVRAVPRGAEARETAAAWRAAAAAAEQAGALSLAEACRKRAG